MLPIWHEIAWGDFIKTKVPFQISALCCFSLGKCANHLSTIRWQQNNSSCKWTTSYQSACSQHMLEKKIRYCICQHLLNVFLALSITPSLMWLWVGLLAHRKPSFRVQHNQYATLCFPEPSQRGWCECWREEVKRGGGCLTFFATKSHLVSAASHITSSAYCSTVCTL